MFGQPKLMNDQVSLADFAIGGEPGAAGAKGWQSLNVAARPK
jgi:hypothetical protein